LRFLDALLGRTKAVAPNLDALFNLPSAAVTLEVSAGLRPTGEAAVCYKPASGQGFASTAEEASELLAFASERSGTRVETTEDSYGYRWVALADPELDDLVASAHLVNRTLEERGFGPQLLCSVFGFGGADGRCHLVYLYKRGTFYPFAPRQSERRDNELELRVRSVLDGELPIEPDLSRWFPMWGLPLS
jgi:hypothetical protein